MSTRNLAIDPDTGDLALDGARLRLVSGVESIAQAVRSNLRWIAGEWFVNTAGGLDYFGTVLSQKPTNLGAVRKAVEDAILATPGIASVASLTVTPDYSARTLAVEFEAVTDTGELLTVTV